LFLQRDTNAEKGEKLRKPHEYLRIGDP